MNQTFLYALRHVTAPSGSALRLYGGPESVTGDLYNTAYGAPDRGQNVISDLRNAAPEYDAVYLSSPKQREETEALLAFALSRSRGFVMAAAANDAGGGRLQEMLEAYGIDVSSESKNHCRVVWTTQAKQAEKTRIARHLALLQPQPLVLDGESWWTMPGLFGWDKIDPGSSMLLQHLPKNIAGKVADFGCGYGYLSKMLAHNHPAIESIDAFDVDARAVECCARNGNEKITARWQDIRTLESQRNYDAIVMNPPFHSGKAQNLELGTSFIRKAGACLKKGGKFFLVANRHLPYEKTVPGLTILHEDAGYKIMKGSAA